MIHMNVFVIQRPQIKGRLPPGKDSWVSGAHKWRLPAAKCGKCGGSRAGGWGDPALAYPHIDIPTNLKRSEYTVRSPIPWTEYLQLRKPLRELVPSDMPLPPGTDFGPWVGEASGPLTDFAGVWDWECLVRQGVLERLNQKLSTQIQAIPAQIRSRRKEKPDYLELVALPMAVLSNGTMSQLTTSHCDACGQQFVSDGYFAYGEPPGIGIQICRSSLPKDKHVFRIRELSRYVLCTAEFREAVLDLGLQNISFSPIEVVDE